MYIYISMYFFIASSARPLFHTTLRTRLLVYRFLCAGNEFALYYTPTFVRVFRAFPFFFYRFNFVLSNIAHSYVSMYLFYLCCKYVL